MPSANDIQNLIDTAINCEHVEVYSPDEVHFQALIVSSTFTGKSLIHRHQAVYRALGDKMQGEIHALSMNTLTPEEWRPENKGG